MCFGMPVADGLRARCAGRVSGLQAQGAVDHWPRQRLDSEDWQALRRASSAVLSSGTDHDGLKEGGRHEGAYSIKTRAKSFQQVKPSLRITLDTDHDRMQKTADDAEWVECILHVADQSTGLRDRDLLALGTSESGSGRLPASSPIRIPGARQGKGMRELGRSP